MRYLSIALFLVAGLTSSGCGQDLQPGEFVVVLQHTPALDDDGNKVGQLAAGDRFRIRALDGDVVQQDGTQYWVSRADVVPLNDAGLPALSERIANNPEQLRLYLARARIHHKAERYQDEVNDLNHVLSVDPNYIDAIRQRGYYHWKREEHEKALKDLDYVVEQLPSDWRTHFTRGVVLTDMGELDAAKQAYEAVQRLNPAYVETYDQLGTINTVQKNYKEAIAYFTLSLRLSPDDSNTLTSRGGAYYELKQWDTALRDFDRALAIAPNDVYAYCGKAQAEEKLGRSEQAATSFRRASELASSEASKAYYLAMAWKLEGARGKALNQLNRAIAANPHEVAYFVERGEVNVALGRHEKAISDFTRSIEMDPTSGRAHYFRAFEYLTLNNYEAAFADYEVAKRLQPDQMLHDFCLATTGMLLRHPESLDYASAFLDNHPTRDWRRSALLVEAYLYARILGNEERASQFRAMMKEPLDEQWPKPATQWILGEIDEKKLLNDFAKDDVERAAARTYLGLQALIDGDVDQAKMHFRWSVQNGDPDAFTHQYAEAELARMGRKRSE